MKQVNSETFKVHVIVMPAVGRDAPFCYGNNSYTESLVPERRTFILQCWKKELISCLQAAGRLELKRLLGRRFKGASLAGSLTSQVLFSKLGSGLSTTS